MGTFVVNGDYDCKTGHENNLLTALDRGSERARRWHVATTRGHKHSEPASVLERSWNYCDISVACAPRRCGELSGPRGRRGFRPVTRRMSYTRACRLM